MREILGEIVAGGQFENSMEMPVDAAAIDRMEFNWLQGADYAFSLGGGPQNLDLVLSLPAPMMVTLDMHNHTLLMTLMHELSHAIRTSKNAQINELFELAENQLLSIDWQQEVDKEPEYKGKPEDWEEEVRADLKMVVLFHRKNGRFPNDAELMEYQNAIGGKRTVAHPPPAFRVGQIKNFIALAGNH